MSLTNDPISVPLDAPVIALHGDYDLERTDELRAALLGGTTGSVVVDMSAVEFIDSTALGVFIEARTAVEDAGHRLVLRDITAAPLRVFEVTGLAGYFGLT